MLTGITKESEIGVSLFLLILISLVNICACNSLSTKPPLPTDGTIIIDSDSRFEMVTWEIAGPGGLLIEGTGDMTLENMESGEYRLNWGEIPGWLVPFPEPSLQTLTPDDIITFAGQYDTLRQLTMSEYSDVEPDWAPHGIGKIVFTSNRSGLNNLWFISTMDGTLEQVTFSTPEKSEAKWSSDGSELAYVTSIYAGDIHRLSLSSGQDFVVTTGFEFDVNPDWMPHTNWIVFSSFSSSCDNSLSVIESTGGEVENLSCHEHGLYEVMDRHPTWSPSGWNIVFSRSQTGFGKSDLYQIELIFYHNQIVHHFDPEAILVTPEIDELHADYSPKSGLVAFTRDFDEQSDIFVIRLSDKELFQVTYSPDFNESDPTWSPDGTSLAFVSDQSGYNNLWVKAVNLESD